MKHFQFTLAALPVFFLSSCSLPIICRNNTLYTVKDGLGGSNQLHKYIVNANFKADVAEQQGFLQLKKMDIDDLQSKNVIREVSVISLTKKTDEPDKTNVIYFGDK